jgi:leucyl aminopeptidase (aminopeptidase T)
MDTSVSSTELPAGARMPVFQPFSLTRLLKTVFRPIEGQKICILIDLEHPEDMENFRFLKNPELNVQRYAYNVFYRGLHEGAMEELSVEGGEIFAYKTTGGSNLDMPDEAYDVKGNKVSLERDVYPHYGIVLAINTFSATAPLTAHAKKHGFRGATLHGLNETIMNTGLSVDYNQVSANAEKLRQAMTGADEMEVDFKVLGETHTLKITLEQQEAQKSHGLCHGLEPDVANLPAGEVYFVPKDAEGYFPRHFEDGTLGLNEVRDRQIQNVTLLSGRQETIDEFNKLIKDDPITGALGELGLGTQVLPVSGRDIQDEKILGTVHVATGRSDHLGGDLTPDQFHEAKHASHDDILFAPHKTPEIHVSEVRMKRGEQEEVVLKDYQPAEYLIEALRD